MSESEPIWSDATLTDADPRQLRAEIERLNRELGETTHEKMQAAEYGLAVLEEKQELQRRHDDLELEYESVKQELSQLKQAFGHAHSNHRKVTADGENREELLLQETASRQALFEQRQLDLQVELRQLRSVLLSTQAENERMAAVIQDLREVNQVGDVQRSRLRDEIKEFKSREGRLQQDFTELEEENICLQKQVSLLKQNQVEFEGLKHETRRLEEDLQFLNGQLEGVMRLKEITERQLAEALETISSEREQKAALRKEISQHLVASSVSPCSLNLPVDGLKASAEESPDAHDSSCGTPASRAEDTMVEDGRFHPAPSLVDELLNELSISEIQKANQQLLQVEREKGALVISLQESQVQLKHTQQDLAEKQEHLCRLQETLSAMRKLQASRSQKKIADVELDNQQDTSDYDLDLDGPEILACKYQLAAAEIGELREELEGLQARHQDEQARFEKERIELEAQVQMLTARMSSLEESNRSGHEKATHLSQELECMSREAREWHGNLSVAQEEMAAFSEELASLYHHVCMSNNETPSRVTLDFYRQGVASSQPSEPDSNSQNEPSDVCNLGAIIRKQLKHLQQAVDRAVEMSRQRGAESGACLPADWDQEACMEEMLKLKALLSTKREQIATLRAVLKANKQTAEVALASLKSKYKTEKVMVTETMTKLRQELNTLKEDAATFSSLRAMFATRCDEYVAQVDELQRQLAAAEEEKKTLNLLLRMAIQQKLALTQRLEDLEFHQEQSSRGGRAHGRVLTGRGRATSHSR
ncbi:protein bicaudal D homolog 2-like [Brienomyrus brachyistius]|uniref:protein bicaudal D homolog 2-like n=1 Tax=Brienomyrus brachyistius TaxID=42636 RepID=UPI0020B3D5EC|nr:protein bicaudal D homolog 2-like [Brienomyrus brachyistius]